MKRKWIRRVAMLLCVTLLCSGCGTNSQGKDATEGDYVTESSGSESSKTEDGTEDTEQVNGTETDNESGNAQENESTENSGNQENQENQENWDNSGSEKEILDANGDGIVDIGYDALPCSEEELRLKCKSICQRRNYRSCKRITKRIRIGAVNHRFIEWQMFSLQ